MIKKEIVMHVIVGKKELKRLLEGTVMWLQITEKVTEDIKKGDTIVIQILPPVS